MSDSGRVVVSGVTSGIGLATSRALIGRGYRVVGLARRADALAELRSELGEAFSFVQVDFSKPESIDHCMRALDGTVGQLTAVVSNAAECAYETPLRFPWDSLARLMMINVVAPLALAQTLTPQLRPGGAFVHVSSITARYLPGAKFAAYAATKTAMETLINGLRLELAPRQIRVSTVTPGLVETPIYDKVAAFEESRKRIKQQVPEWLSPEVVAEAICYVLSQPPGINIPDLVITPTLQTR